MKRIGKFLGVILFVTIYCFAIGRVNTSSLYAASHSSQKGKHISSISEDLFSGSISFQRNLSSSQNIPNPNLKDNFSGPWILEKSHKAVFISKYTQYVSFAKNLLIRHRKADLIFPFQYFW
ncbi:hypothetical protein [Arcticibacterium luteifluviistationis]|uniref:Uncharacterized protein n=1 Tax=Arcticibacterium luteifluviistationis TaxID=1784714 RepID=A0A2Z4G884_9BACT|nr:hypothetical protein [Arcticibacterium luteifluviistationis]AWV97288.1 hypothetical protein DJ013_03530 [Arcticibacterium luteifluviistationis]